MTELINLRLARYAAQSFWRSSTATHFGGVNGTMTFDKDACKALADSGVCPPSPLNESWYASAWCHPKPRLYTCLGPACCIRGIMTFDMDACMAVADSGSARPLPSTRAGVDWESSGLVSLWVEY